MEATAALLLLGAAVASLLLPLPAAAQTLAPPVLAGVALASGVISTSGANAGVRPLLAPLAFVLAAVPMAVLLDRLGFFEELADRLAGGPRFVGTLWILAAVVTATLNLDAAVVLLTPLYVRIAQARGVSAFALALQPALLSGLASSALPISNLTNLIVTGELHLRAGAFVVHLGLANALAVGGGWLAYRAAFPLLSSIAPQLAGGDRVPDTASVRVARRREKGRVSDPRTILVVGGLISVAVVVGFIVVPSFGGEPWEVAAAADVVLMPLCTSAPFASLPIRSVAVVLGLGVLATGAAAHLPIASALSGSSPGDLVRVAIGSAAAANVVNNLPAVLVALPHLGHRASWSAWSVLFGTNAGTLFFPSGSLATLLWLATVRRLGLEVRERDYLRVAWRVAAPGFAAGLAALVVVRLILGAGG